MNYNVIMVNPLTDKLGDQFFVGDPNHIYLTHFMNLTLGYNDVDNRSFLPHRAVFGVDPEDILVRTAEQIVAGMDQDKLNILGFTNYYESVDAALNLGNIIKYYAAERGLEVMIVGGGPTVVRETPGLVRNGELFPDSATALLNQATNLNDNSYVYDGVVYGGTQAFLDLLELVEQDKITKVDGRYIPAELPQGYFIRGEDGTILGQGKSTNFELPMAPLQITEDGIDVMFSNGCRNNCGFCSQGNYSFEFSRDQVGKGLAFKISAGLDGIDLRRIPIINVNDPNPLAEYNQTNTYACLQAIADVIGADLPKAMYVDSALFVDPQQVLDHIHRLNLHKVYVGRDAVTETGAAFMGTRFMGRLKTQDDLDRERAGIERVIRKTAELGKECYFDISIVGTPVDTREDIIAIQRDNAFFRGLAIGDVTVTSEGRLLIPLPGSRVLREHTDLISDRPYFFNGMYKEWNVDAVEQRFPDSCFRETVCRL